MCESIDKNIPLMEPTFFSKDDKNNPKYQTKQNEEEKNEKE